MKEIMCSKDIINAFKELGFTESDYSCTFKANNPYSLCVCSISDELYKAIDNYSEDTWKESWGWWRFSVGSNLGFPVDKGIINSLEVILWRNDHKKLLAKNDFEYISDEEKESDYDNNWLNYYEYWYPNTWNSLLDYFSDEFGVSTETNICALATDMAKANNITLGKLFNNLQGYGLN